MSRRKPKEPNVDGLGPKDIRKIRAALRQVWHWSHAKKLVVRRCTLKDGFARCEGCKRIGPKVFVDHIVQVGDVDEGFIKRLFVSSLEMRGLCKKCHQNKTNEERRVNPPKRRIKDFF